MKAYTQHTCMNSVLVYICIFMCVYSFLLQQLHAEEAYIQYACMNSVLVCICMCVYSFLLRHLHAEEVFIHNIQVRAVKYVYEYSCIHAYLCVCVCVSAKAHTVVFLQQLSVCM